MWCWIEATNRRTARNVTKKLTDASSTWLNNIQYKVKAENIEGPIKIDQIDGLDRYIDGAVDDAEIDDKISSVVEDSIAEQLRQFEVDADSVNDLDDKIEEVVKKMLERATVTGGIVL